MVMLEAKVLWVVDRDFENMKDLVVVGGHL